MSETFWFVSHIITTVTPHSIDLGILKDGQANWVYAEMKQGFDFCILFVDCNNKTIGYWLAGTIPATKVYTRCNVRREADVTDDLEAVLDAASYWHDCIHDNLLAREWYS